VIQYKRPGYFRGLRPVNGYDGDPYCYSDIALTRCGCHSSLWFVHCVYYAWSASLPQSLLRRHDWRNCVSESRPLGLSRQVLTIDRGEFLQAPMAALAGSNKRQIGDENKKKRVPTQFRSCCGEFCSAVRPRSADVLLQKQIPDTAPGDSATASLPEPLKSLGHREQLLMPHAVFRELQLRQGHPRRLGEGRTFQTGNKSFHSAEQLLFSLRSPVLGQQ